MLLLLTFGDRALEKTGPGLRVACQLACVELGENC